MKNGDKTAKTDEEKAELFAESFREKVHLNSRKAEPKDSVYHGEKIPKLQEFFNEKIEFSKEMVMNVTKNLPNKRCCGVDKLPLKIYKNKSERYHQILADLFN